MSLPPERRFLFPKPYGYLSHNGLISAVYTEADYRKLLDAGGWEASSKTQYDAQRRRSVGRCSPAVRESRPDPKRIK